jgi:carbon monoxide dehydrogenase subunit G
MLKKILIVLAAVIVVLGVVIATRPDTYRVERSTRVAAPPDVVFGLVNDFHRWDEWSPWSKLDPNMKKTLAGSPAGVGATYAWAGDKKVGEGNMRITESRPPEKVGIRLEFTQPWQAVSQTEFTFKPDGNGTRVNWAMNGTNNLMSKAFGLFADMDAMIGKDFDQGLLSMKKLAEDTARANAAAAAGASSTPPPTTPSVPAPQTPAPAGK